MKVNVKFHFFLRKDSLTMLVHRRSARRNLSLTSTARMPAGLRRKMEMCWKARTSAGYDDVIRAANSSLQNMDVLLKRHGPHCRFRGERAGFGWQADLRSRRSITGSMRTVAEFQNSGETISPKARAAWAS